MHDLHHLQTFDELEQHQWECQQDEWEREKQKILNTLLGSGPEAPNYHHESHVKFVTHYHDMYPFTCMPGVAAILGDVTNVM